MSGLQIFAIGRIAAQGSKTRSRTGHMYEASKYLGPWRAELVRATREALDETESWNRNTPSPVKAEIDFRFARPKSHYRTDGVTPKDNAPPFWHVQRPDLDKLVRAVLDALTQAEAITDDSRVASIRASKTWTEVTPSCAHIILREIRE